MTGVQTCALPICITSLLPWRAPAGRDFLPGSLRWHLFRDPPPAPQARPRRAPEDARGLGRCAPAERGWGAVVRPSLRVEGRAQTARCAARTFGAEGGSPGAEPGWGGGRDLAPQGTPLPVPGDLERLSPRSPATSSHPRRAEGTAWPAQARGEGRQTPPIGFRPPARGSPLPPSPGRRRGRVCCPGGAPS